MNEPTNDAVSLGNALSALFDARRRLFRCIARELAIDDHCKPYEGAVAIRLPNYFDDRDGSQRITITLDCYVIGPLRHYSWSGDSFVSVAVEAVRDINSWCDEHELRGTH